MNYVSYLKTIFPDYEVTDEVNYKWDMTKTALVIKNLTGTNYKDSTIQPVQINVYTTTPATVKEELQNFTKTYNNMPFIENTDYVQQIYSTPMLISSFDNTGNNFGHQFLINVTLIISTNVSDIKEVKIDNVIYETTGRIFSYMATPDNQRVSENEINTSFMSNATVKFNCSLINKNNSLTTKLRALRQGLIDIDSLFTITLIFSDNATPEVYQMKLDSFSINSENQSLPIISLSFIK